MPIVVKHGAPVAGVGGLAESVGYQSYMDKIGALQNQNYALKQQGLNIRPPVSGGGGSSRRAPSRSVSGYAPRSSSSSDAAARRLAADMKNRIDSLSRGRSPVDVDTYSKEDLMKVELQKMLKRAQKEQGQEESDLEFSPQQQQQIMDLNMAMNWVNREVSSGRMKPDEGIEAVRQINQQINGIIPQRKGKGPSIEEQVAKETVRDKDGTMWYKTKDGLKPMLGGKNQDREFMYESRLKAYEKAEAMVERSAIATGIPTMKIDEAYETVAKMLGLDVPGVSAPALVVKQAPEPTLREKAQALFDSAINRDKDGKPIHSYRDVLSKVIAESFMNQAQAGAVVQPGASGGDMTSLPPGAFPEAAQPPAEEAQMGWRRKDPSKMTNVELGSTAAKMTADAKEREQKLAAAKAAADRAKVEQGTLYNYGLKAAIGEQLTSAGGTIAKLWKTAEDKVQDAFVNITKKLGALPLEANVTVMVEMENLFSAPEKRLNRKQVERLIRLIEEQRTNAKMNGTVDQHSR